ncbi:MAG: malto-oligosyltrehalose trehalohydrolase [Burkholderiaceae bacterium]|nr:malto-oligosyltrehalose trehalohydrolase [Burkholderiaceae bacterium]
MKRLHAMPFGALPKAGAGARFRLWAPARERVTLELLQRDGREAAAGSDAPVALAVPMQRCDDGWHAADAVDAPAGTLYRFRLDEQLAVPDPASRFNPFDVHGPSELVDPLAYDWHDGEWRGRRWHEAVIYEMHVGTFTDEGTFDAARERLAELASLGVTAVELMPVADFPGTRGWGYDGVLPFAPDAAYGRPDAFKRFVDHAHSLGLMVLLDVVYNHFGPEGNYLRAYAPQFFDASRRTPWGDALSFDAASSGPVRAFFVNNALYWVLEYSLDGLRIDAVHAIEDRSSPDLIEEIARALRDGPERDRFVHVVLENDRNDTRYLRRAPDGAPRIANAQWNDDLHHALHVVLTAETDGYYADYADAPIERLGRALAEGFVYQGEPSPFRGGTARGMPSAQLPPSAFVAFVHTHDQVGNRAFGERLDALADPRFMPAALACALLGAQVPMLFMGDEYAASTPFLYFCDFGPELAEAVRNGRRAEFGRFQAFRDPAAREAIPDPNAVQTFIASKLDHAERSVSPHRERLALVARMLAARRSCIERSSAIRRAGRWHADGRLLSVRWTPGDGAADSASSPADGALALHLNFGDTDAMVDAGASFEPRFVHAAARGQATAAWTLAPGGVLYGAATGKRRRG